MSAHKPEIVKHPAKPAFEPHNPGQKPGIPAQTTDLPPEPARLQSTQSKEGVAVDLHAGHERMTIRLDAGRAALALSVQEARTLCTVLRMALSEVEM